MANPENVPEFLAEVTSQTVGESVSARDALRRAIDSSADTGRTYLSMLGAFEQAGLRATLDFQDAVLRASQGMFDATVRADKPVKSLAPQTGRLWPEPTLKLTARGTYLIPGSPQDAPCDDADQRRADDWANSGLRFQAPLGMIVAELADLDDEI